MSLRASMGDVGGGQSQRAASPTFLGVREIRDPPAAHPEAARTQSLSLLSHPEDTAGHLNPNSSSASLTGSKVPLCLSFLLGNWDKK
jgi:hypothetical protein